VRRLLIEKLEEWSATLGIQNVGGGNYAGVRPAEVTI
jgi:hypothetical protein